MDLLIPPGGVKIDSWYSLIVIHILQMSLMTTAFSDLIAAYSTWDSLHAHLLSPEGGKLRVIVQAESPLAIIRYTRGISDFTNKNVPLFRSVVWNTVTHRPVSVAPPKSEDGLPPTDVPLTVTEFVDGTMIQCFRMDPASASASAAPASAVEGAGEGSVAQIQIATRTSLGAHGTFYSKRSFAELFADSIAPLGGMESFLDSVLGPNDFISCVLQHPEHVTVEHVNEPRFFVTHVGSVMPDGGVQMTTHTDAWPARLIPFAPKDHSQMPVYIPDAQALVAETSRQLTHTFQGLMFTGGGGRRWRVRNPAYMIVRALRGSESTAAERFLRLRKQMQVKEYLKYFREESAILWALEETLRAVTQGLYDAYVAVHKVKNAEFKSFHVSFRPHIYALHGLYLTSVANGIAKPILKETVIGYVNALGIADQANLVRWAPASLAPPLEEAEPSPGVHVVPGVYSYATAVSRSPV